MARRARRFTVQAYIIVGPVSEPGSNKRVQIETDYIPARDQLIDALEADGPGYLRLPTGLSNVSGEPMLVMVDQYRVDETRERGGIAVFDILFLERGIPPAYDVWDSTQAQVTDAGTNNVAAVQNWLDATLDGQGPGGSMVIDSVDAYRRMFGGQ